MTNFSSSTPERRPPVMSDVAIRAGVSHQTVSRVLNSPALVKSSTRDRVLQAIEELGYRRNMNARALVTTKTHVIGVVTPSSQLYGPLQTTMAIQDSARQAGYATAITSPPEGSLSEHRPLEFFAELGVDGIIVISPTFAIALGADPSENGPPVVAVSAEPHHNPRVQTVGIDHVAGARLATRHLIDLGHRRIAHVGGPPDWHDARAREQGWREELAAAGLPAEAPMTGSWSAAHGYEAAMKIVGVPRRDRPTSIFAANDLIALGVIRALANLGVSIPAEMSLVGYDDAPGCEFYEPPLTTVRQPFHEVGELAVTTLLAALQDAPPKQHAPYRPELITRASSAVAMHP